RGSRPSGPANTRGPRRPRAERQQRESAGVPGTRSRRSCGVVPALYRLDFDRGGMLESPRHDDVFTARAGKMSRVSPLATPPNLNPDRMRRIDRWLGIPICFALTIIARLGSFVSPRGSHSADGPRNALFIELAEMGS